MELSNLKEIQKGTWAMYGIQHPLVRALSHTWYVL